MNKGKIRTRGFTIRAKIQHESAVFEIKNKKLNKIIFRSQDFFRLSIVYSIEV